MKNRLIYGMILGIFSSMYSLYGCVNLMDFFSSPLGQEVFTYVEIEGQQYFKSFVKATIKSLIFLHDQQPDVLNAYINACLGNIKNPFTDQALIILKQFNLIQSDATINSVIQNIVSMAVEQLENGDIKIWSLGELIQDNWVSVF